MTVFNPLKGFSVPLSLLCFLFFSSHLSSGLVFVVGYETSQSWFASKVNLPLAVNVTKNSNTLLLRQLRAEDAGLLYLAALHA